MKTSVLKFIFCAVLCLTALWVAAQTKSSITIKSITIQDGDTLVNEKKYTGDAYILISDSLFDTDSRFLFFNNGYTLDTNFNKHFSDEFGREVGDFIKKFNKPSENLFDQNFNFFDNSNMPNYDSIFKKFNLDITQIPDAKSQYLNNPPHNPMNSKRYIIPQNMVTSVKEKITDFDLTTNPLAETCQVRFMLDPSKPSIITLRDASHKKVCSECLPKSVGLYTRLFDFAIYKPGVYTLKVMQGKKFAQCELSIQMANHCN
ncbi:MAG: hypothetical protein WCQ95_13185 [Bacteroidota bacterium]